MSGSEAHRRSGVEHRFTPTTLLIMGGLLIWMADFVFVYVFAAVACARRFADVQIVGMGIVPAVTTVATLLAGVVTTVLIRVANRRTQLEADEHGRFIYFVTLATSAIALVALLWLLLPPLTVHACASGG